MKVSYYPGCSLRGTGKEYGESTEAAMKALGVELVELDDWNCCGASSAHSMGKELAVEVAARNLLIAKDSGIADLLIPCSACYQRTKVAEYDLMKHPESYPGIKYNREVNIIDIVSFIHDKIGLNSLKKSIKKKLTGLKAVCYYGCLTSRPPKILKKDNYENPVDMDEIMEALGAEVIDWGYKTDCCGASLALSQPGIIYDLTGKLYEKALEAGAECIIVSCPLCHSNLDMYQRDISKKFGKKFNIPIYYISELVGLAIGEENVSKWLKRHVMNPVKLLKEKGLL